MSESGRRCRPSSRRAPRDVEEFGVKLDGTDVQIELRGRLVRTLVGAAADEV
ncbi:MAG: hypothetical protein IAG13_24690, partial [Deltaproteobacteria bacterium]|nr:hypothetical protein [Nannocystaceae bacterium]